MKIAKQGFRTPKRTKDWYIKWISSLTILVAMSLRGTGRFPFTDMLLSFLGCLGWIWVSVLWKDKALLVLNTVASFILFGGILNSLLG